MPSAGSLHSIVPLDFFSPFHSFSFFQLKILHRPRSLGFCTAVALALYCPGLFQPRFLPLGFWHRPASAQYGHDLTVPRILHGLRRKVMCPQIFVPPDFRAPGGQEKSLSRSLLKLYAASSEGSATGSLS